MSESANESAHDATQVMGDTSSAPYQAPVVFANRYEVRALLGQGAMGSVFRVHDRELDEDVALKVLLRGSSDPSAVNRFRREVRLARRVTHPNVARTYDLGQHDEVKFLTMELVGGEGLGSLLRARGPFSLSDALRIAEQIARGLSAAHAVGVVHRDLKPDNVMAVAGASGRVVITDFGIARLAEGAEGSDQRRTTHQAVGTPAYMAPEQAKNEPVDGRTDVYALATLLFEMLTGETPFPRQGALAMLAARLTQDPRDVREVNAGIPEAVALLLKRALVRRREDRPDAEAILQAIERLRGSGEGHVRAAPLARSLAVAPVDVESPNSGRARDLGTAIADGLSQLRGIEVFAPNVVESAQRGRDVRAAAHDLGASFLVEASVRDAGTCSRLRARLVEVEKGAQIWAAPPIDAPLGERFAVEDQLVQIVTNAVRERLGEASVGTVDPDVERFCNRATAAAGARSLPAIQEAIRILEEGRLRYPSHPSLLCSEATQLVRLWSMTGAADAALAGRAEEMALRALAANPSLAEAYFTIGMLRLEQGELRAAVRAFQEAFARAPMYADPNVGLGVLLAETGNVDEAARRFDAALRLDPSNVSAMTERARMRALRGDRDGAERDIRALGFAGTSLLVRAVFWWNDRARAGSLADAFERAPTGAAWEASAPFVRALSVGQPFAGAAETLRRMVSTPGLTVRNACRILEGAVDYFGSIGERENALHWLENASSLPFVNLLWLDQSVCLEPLRGDPRFTRARALVAARAADLWR